MKRMTMFVSLVLLACGGAGSGGQGGDGAVPTNMNFPTYCQYTYSGWSECQTNPNGGMHETRTVLTQNPAECEGTPVVEQSCIVPCLYSYTDWSSCAEDGMQSREVVETYPQGCNGVDYLPVLTQTCDFVWPEPAAEMRFVQAVGASTLPPLEFESVSSVGIYDHDADGNWYDGVWIVMDWQNLRLDEIPRVEYLREWNPMSQLIQNMQFPIDFQEHPGVLMQRLDDGRVRVLYYFWKGMALMDDNNKGAWTFGIDLVDSPLHSERWSGVLYVHQ